MIDAEAVQLGGAEIYDLEWSDYQATRVPPRPRSYRRRMRRRYRRSYPFGELRPKRRERADGWTEYLIPPSGESGRASIDEIDCNEAAFRLAIIGEPFGAAEIANWVTERRQLYYRAPAETVEPLRPAASAVAQATLQRAEYEIMLRAWGDLGRVGKPPHFTPMREDLLKSPFVRVPTSDILNDLLVTSHQRRDASPSTNKALKSPLVLTALAVWLCLSYIGEIADRSWLVTFAGFCVGMPALVVAAHGLPIRRPTIRGVLETAAAVVPLLAICAVVILWP